jgi:hypothetical protein
VAQGVCNFIISLSSSSRVKRSRSGSSPKTRETDEKEKKQSKIRAAILSRVTTTSAAAADQSPAAYHRNPSRIGEGRPLRGDESNNDPYNVGEGQGDTVDEAQIPSQGKGNHHDS